MSNPVRYTLRLYRDAFSGHPKEIWLLGGVTFINRVGTMILPFLTVYLTSELNFSMEDAGFLAGAFGLGSAGGSYLGGKLTDRIGANNVMIISLFLGGLFFISLQWFFSFEFLFVLIFLSALFGEAYRPAMQVAARSHVEKEQMGRTMSLIRLAINLGWSAAPVVGGIVASTLGYEFLFWIDGLTCIVAAIFFGYVSRSLRKRKKDDPEKDMESSEVAINPLRNRHFMMFVIACLLLGICFVQWFYTVPVFLKREWGFDEKDIGLLLGISAFIIAIIEMPVIHSIEAKKRIRASFLGGILLVGISYLLFLLDGSFGIALFAIVIWTFGELFHIPLNSSVAINMSPDSRRGDYMAWYWMAWSLTGILTPVISLPLAKAFGYHVLWIGIMLVTGLSFLIFALIPKDNF